MEAGDRINFLLTTWERAGLLPVWVRQGAGPLNGSSGFVESLSDSLISPRSRGFVAGHRGVLAGVFSTIIVSPGLRCGGVAGGRGRVSMAFGAYSSTGGTTW